MAKQMVTFLCQVHPWDPTPKVTVRNGSLAQPRYFYQLVNLSLMILSILSLLLRCYFLHYLYEWKFKICYYFDRMPCLCCMLVIFTPFLWTNKTLLFTRNMLRKEMIQLPSIHQSCPHLVEIVIGIVLSINRDSPPVPNSVISIVRTVQQRSSHLTEILILMSPTKGCGKMMWWRKKFPWHAL